MEFYNRENEISRLKQSMIKDSGNLIVVYGRRRCGKSTLIKKVIGENDIYYMATQADASLQRAQLARAIGEKIKGFENIIYPDWDALFTNLSNSSKVSLTLCIDEFPYLVKSSPQLPSIIQRLIDDKVNFLYHLILCGSSQQMMQGLVLDSSAPLYGRAEQILKISPLKAGWIKEALNCSHSESIEEYSVWGGVPRYWELRNDETTFEKAVKNIILDPLGTLYEEPARLFLDDMRESVQAQSILSVIGKGCNRISEIAGRLNKPTTQLPRPLEILINLGYVKRETPFGEPLRSSKKSLYRISDPFMNFYYTYIVPNISRLELGLKEMVFVSLKQTFKQFVAAEWENLCRLSIPFREIDNIAFDVAHRWWGNNIEGEKMELDIVSESLDKKHLLVGECKWSEVNNPGQLLDQLKRKAKLLPKYNDRIIIPILFVKTTNISSLKNIFLPKDVLSVLK